MLEGIRIFNNICDFEARRDFIKSIKSGGTDNNPLMEFISTGKRTTSTVITILGNIPKPNQITNNGAKDNLGRLCIEIIMG